MIKPRTVRWACYVANTGEDNFVEDFGEETRRKEVTLERQV
jgi:hypothetical protein